MADISPAIQRGNNALRFEIVTTLAQFMHVMAIRAIAYMERTQFPADQAFDGNDFQCTHILAYLGDEPIGAMRIRWFKDFAKVERTGFRPAYNANFYLKQMVAFVFSHIARKGYSRIITHASIKYARLWQIMFRMKRVEKPAAIYFGEEYVELEKTLEVPTNAVTSESPVEILFRTEGSWDETGRYETVG
jgi:hypothetical protein